MSLLHHKHHRAGLMAAITDALSHALNHLEARELQQRKCFAIGVSIVNKQHKNEHQLSFDLLREPKHLWLIQVAHFFPFWTLTVFLGMYLSIYIVFRTIRLNQLRKFA